MVWRFFFLLILPFSVCGQISRAALEHSLRSAESKGDADSINFYALSLGYSYLNEQNFDSANFYYKKALRSGNYVDHPERLAETLNNLGITYSKSDFLDSSIHYFNAALHEYKSLDDTLHIPLIEVNLGILYKDKGLYEKSLTYLLNASQKLEMGDPSTLASCYNSIGNVYSKIGELRLSLDFHYRSLKIKQQIKAVKAIGSSYNNIGNVYLLLNENDSALENFEKSLKIKRALNDKSGEGIGLNNMGELMVKMDKLEDAEELFKKALAIRLGNNDKVGQVMTRNNLGHLYVLKDNLGRAEAELKKSAALASSIGVLEPLKTNYEIQVMLYKKKHDFKKALEFSQQLLIVKDSLLNQEKAQSLAEMQTRYESGKKEDRITLLEKEGLLQTVEIDRKQIWIRGLVVAVVLTFIIGLLIYYNLRTVKKNKIHIELLLKELHHRVKNNLQILSSLLSLQSQQLTDDSAIKAVKSSESRINAMALIHRKLYSVDQNRTVDIKEYITELIQYLVYSYGYHERHFKLDLEIRHINIDVDKAIPLGLILNELISNAFKHAYENEPNPKLVINLDFPDVHQLDIQIADNGAGIHLKDDQKKTFGMKIVTTLLKELKGSLDVKSGNGTTYVLHIPL